MITISTGHSVRPRIALAAVALLCAGLAACSSPGSSGPTSAPASSSQAAFAEHTSSPAGIPASGAPAAASSGSACDLLTATEVTTAVGKPMAVGPNGGNVCVYSGKGDPSLLVYVQTYPDTQAMATPKEIESAGQHLPGLGDDAFWSGAGSVFVQRGTRAFLITIPSLGLTPNQDAPPAIVMLATQALARF